MENNFEKHEFVETSFDTGTEFEEGSRSCRETRSNQHKQTSLLSRDSLSFFLYSKEFVIAGTKFREGGRRCREWLTKLSFRPTPLSIISSTTIYLIAIFSTIQRREGDRWFAFLFNVKMPGYNTTYQETTWETFENITAKYLNLSSDNVLGADVRPKFNRLPLSDGSVGRPCLRSKAEQRSQAQGTEFRPVKYVDLYKDKALIFLNTPFEKQIRKDFVGFYAKKPTLSELRSEKAAKAADNGLRIAQGRQQKLPSEKGSTKRKFFKISDKDHIALPWYRIDACPRYSRAIIPKVDQELLLKEPSCSALLRKQGWQPKLPCQNAVPASSRKKIKRNLIGNTVTGLQYAFPFYKSKESIYVENDSIPFKLESPYSTFVSVDKADSQSALSPHEPSTQLNRYCFAPNNAGTGCLAKGGMCDLRSQAQEGSLSSRQLLAALKDNKKGFSGKYVLNFQEKLQNLFYSYGLSPPPLANSNAVRNTNKKRTQQSALHAAASCLASQESALLRKSYRQELEDQSTQATDGSESGLPSVLRNSRSASSAPASAFNALSDSHIETIVNELCINVANLTHNHQQKNVANSGFHYNLSKWNLLKKNDVMCTRLMSGYKLPEYTKQETSRLFRKYVLPHLFLSSWIHFSNFYLTNQVVLRPFYIKLPPALGLRPVGRLLSQPPLVRPTVASPSNAQGTPLRHLNITYKQLSLQELKEVKDVFIKLGRDYEEYLSLPKDSAPAIRISASLEDDKILKLEAERKEKKDDEKPTTFEQLQTLRGRERKFELGKTLRPFAYKNQLASQTDGYYNCNNKKPNSSLSAAKAIFSEPRSDKKTNEENSWIRFRLGPKNLLSDRKQSFFGRKEILTKRLVAQEQKEVNEQIIRNSQSQRNKEGYTELIDEQILRSKSYRKLQRRARKGLIKLLGSLDFSAHHVVGSQDRTRKPNIALRGKVLKSAYSHLRWQKKRFHSRLLGTPSQRHLVMPQITVNDWKKILEWQLKNYFLLEEQRLQPLKKDNPGKTFKVRQLNMYLPWVTIRTPLNKPFQWPLTRLDYADTFAAANTAFSGESELRSDKESKAVLWPRQPKVGTSFGQHSFSNNSYELPTYNPVYYWDSGKAVSLSNCVSTSFLPKIRWQREEAFLPNKELRSASPAKTSVSEGQGGQRNGVPTKPSSNNVLAKESKPVIQTRVLNEPYLCEPLTNQSWLLIYRLFLVFAFKNVLKYVYRISLKDFIIKMANSDFGLMVTSSEMREWLEHAPPKSFYTPRKRLQDVAAIEESIPTLSDIIWYLRNYGRGRAGGHGLLLVGPAGAEKTSVVQAIAGECEVPVIVQSMSALANTFDDPYERLENVFKLARKQAPCVLFLDDLDAMGQSRAHVITNDVGAEDLLFSLDTYTAEGKLCFANLSHSLHMGYQQSRSGADSLSQTDQSQGKTASFLHSNWTFNPLSENPAYQPNVEFLPEHELNKNETGRAQTSQNLITFQQNQEFQTRKLNLLLRLLTEMDGISPLNGVVIVATSERPALLDPALVRAGRFERRIHLSLPNKERRIQLFKRETKKIGCITSMPWDYLGLRTTNMSGADIFSAINHSAIRAILDNTVHTIETLEHGLNCVIGLPNKKMSRSSLSKRSSYKGLGSGLRKKSLQKIEANIQLRQNTSRFDRTSVKYNDPFHKSRLAFYQAGKAVLHNLLLDHPQLGVLSLDELVSMNNNSLSKNTIVSARTRIQFETRLVGLYAGKAAELLHLSSNQVSYSLQSFASSDPQANSVRGAAKAASAAALACEAKPSKGRKPLLAKQSRASGTGITQAQGFGQNSNTSGTFRWLWQSNLGFSELLTASSLICLMIDRWYLYSQKVFTFKINRVAASLNHEQIKDETLFPLAKRFSKELEFDLLKPGFWGIPLNSYQKSSQNTNLFSHNSSVPQKRNKTHWWEARVCQALEMGERPYGKWYRIYLPKVEERELNEEWVPPDSILHQSLTLSNINAAASRPHKADLAKEETRYLKTLNDLYLLERDSSYQNAVLNCFYSAFDLLSENREILDLFADHLIRFKILRSHEIAKICSFFFLYDHTEFVKS